MKSKILLFTALTLIAACKKDKSSAPPVTKVYWGNAIYNSPVISRDNSTYQSFPTSLGNDAIDLQPKQTYGQPSKSADEMIAGDTCYFPGINKVSGLCYLNDITSKVNGIFLTTRKIQIAPCTWGNRKLTKGTVILNDDNSVDLEYSDSVLNNSNQTNHYKAHYTK